MALNKKDLGQIKGAVKETMLEAMGSEPIKKVLKETVLEVMEPMMIVSQKEFVKIDERFDKVDKEIDEKFDKIMIGQDKILKGIEDLKSEQKVDVIVHKRQDKKLENHETRIKIIERKVGIAAVK